jgi:hypothetical protein
VVVIDENNDDDDDDDDDDNNDDGFNTSSFPPYPRLPLAPTDAFILFSRDEVAAVRNINDNSERQTKNFVRCRRRR